MDDLVPFGGVDYFAFLTLLVFGRGMDFLSTWIATPNLVLEANPLARKLGWRGSIALNVVICPVFALWPLPALMITTTSLLVAAHNLQNGWLMRSLGEHEYRLWMARQIQSTHLGLFLFCLGLQTALFGGIGAALVIFSPSSLVPFAIGMGTIAYAIALLVYTLLSVRRIRRSTG